MPYLIWSIVFEIKLAYSEIKFNGNPAAPWFVCVCVCVCDH